MVALVIDIDPVAYNLNTFGPLCFTRDTLLAAPGGCWRAAGEVGPGDWLLDRNGYRIRVLARVEVTQNGPASPLAETIRLPGGAGVTRQHRVVLCGPVVEMHFGRRSVLAPAVVLAEAGLARRAPARVGDYVHLLTERHAALLADGSAAESLLLGPQARLAIEGVQDVEDAALSLLEARFPHVSTRACLPVVRRREALMLLRGGARLFTRGHPEVRTRRGRAA